MNMDFTVNLSHEQKLIMTQQMQLSIKLLQMSSYELQQYINEQLEVNPVLEKSDVNTAKTDNNETYMKYKELIKYLDFDNYSHSNISRDEEVVSPFTFISNTKTLKEYLLEQIIELDEDKEVRDICSYFAENIDERGYLAEDIREIAHELKKDEGVINKALTVFQSLDPSGIGARDIKECLKIQLRKKSIENKEVFYIIDNFLELMAEGKYSFISKKMSLDIKDVQKYCDLIKSLGPKPSSGFFTGEETKYIIPDAYITKIYGKYYVIMNDGILPQLVINNVYKDVLPGELSKDVKEYVRGKINDAAFLINSIERRKDTVYKILRTITDMQKDYFDSGERYLKPMTVKEIASKINVHESTVSRAIKNKYVSTNRGVIQIKKLFSSSLPASDRSSEEVSVITVKDTIRNLIEKEDKTNPLSDQKIADIISESGIAIARRTVAKYREELEIMSSSRRKRF